MADEKVWRAPDARPLGQDSLDFGMIISIMRQRRTMDDRLIKGMIAVRDRYNGDVVVPMPDVKNSPAMAPPVPNLVIEALDSLAMRANSTTPRITMPPLDWKSSSSNDHAETRRRSMYGHWHESQLDIKLFRAYRHYAGYGTFSMVTLFDDRTQRAVVELRDPLTSYPELRAPDDIREPKNVGFIFGRSVDWIRSHFPTQSAAFITNAAGKSWDTLWDVVEWIDEFEIVVGIMGPKIPAYGPVDARPYGYTAYELARWPNRAGCVPVVAPRRVTLDRIQGQMTSLLGFNDTFGRATALDFVAMERAIFPDLVVIGQNGAPPQIFSGDWHDGREGKANVLANASVQVLERGPGPMSQQVLAGMERAIRSTGGAPGIDDLAGQRTGAGTNALASLTVDPRMQEAQTVMQRALTMVNTHIMKTELGYAPSQKYTIIPGLRSDMNSVEVQPDRDYDFTENVVDYPYPGLDITQLSVAMIQLQGAELISKKTARSGHPLIDDPMQEETIVTLEQLDLATLNGISQQIEQGTFPGGVPAIAHMRKLVSEGKELYEAVLETTAIAQTGQPAPGTPGAPDPNAPPDPNTPPGQNLPQAAQQMLAGGAGQPPPGAPPATPLPPGGIGDVPPAMANSRHLLQAINANVSSSAV